jgi:hypothetical protein
MITGFNQVVEGFENLILTDFSPIAQEVENRYEEQVYAKDAIDTGRYIQSIGFHPLIQSTEIQSFEVDTSRDPEVFYDGFVDQGTIYITPRYMARGAIESLSLQDVLDVMVGDAFSNAE